MSAESMRTSMMDVFGKRVVGMIYSVVQDKCEKKHRFFFNRGGA